MRVYNIYINMYVYTYIYIYGCENRYTYVYMCGCIIYMCKRRRDMDVCPVGRTNLL